VSSKDRFSASIIQRTLQVNGLQMGATLAGQQEADRTLVLLHGFTGSASGWGKLLDRLAWPDMRVVALDMLGHGKSDAPTDPQRYSMEHCQADMIAALLQLGVTPGKAILLGYSMGGRIALFCAFSGFFHALILESASPGLADPGDRERRCASDEALARRIERSGVPAFVDYWEQLPLFSSQEHLPSEKREALREQRLRNRAIGLANSLRGVGTGAQPALHERLPKLNLPVLLIAGELDTKFCAIARQMEQSLPQVQMSIVAGAGHTIHLEQSATFIALVKQFCLSLVF